MKWLHTEGQSSRGIPIAVPGAGGGNAGIIGDIGDPDPC